MGFGDEITDIDNPGDKTYRDAATEAAIIGLKNAAKITYAYYVALIHEGMPDDLARELTKSWADNLHGRMQ